ncbi:hypothetical protein GCM10011402_36320 [Paracoccus acridae]|uniref:Uncharacterized protein n=1 Tax=Paracoccus acridae TaxID=1795310 RepID=A0ABQ1VM58_9RHOB|nr:hypothetical protein GCM10011402_36320 [Paracoccus acridae]
MEEIDGAPEQFLEIGLEPGVTEACHQGVEDVGHGGGDGVRLRKRPGVGLILKGAPAVKLEFGQDVLGLGGGVDRLGGLVVGILCHRVLLRWGRDPRFSRPSRASQRTGGPDGQPSRLARALMAKAGYFASRCKASAGRGGK